MLCTCVQGKESAKKRMMRGMKLWRWAVTNELRCVEPGLSSAVAHPGCQADWRSRPLPDCVHGTPCRRATVTSEEVNGKPGALEICICRREGSAFGAPAMAAPNRAAQAQVLHASGSGFFWRATGVTLKPLQGYYGHTDHQGQACARTLPNMPVAPSPTVQSKQAIQTAAHP